MELCWKNIVGQPVGPYEDHSLHPNHWTHLLMQRHAQSQQIKSAKQNIETSKLRTPKQCLILYACVSCSKFYQHTNSLDCVHAVCFFLSMYTHTHSSWRRLRSAASSASRLSLSAFSSASFFCRASSSWRRISSSSSGVGPEIQGQCRSDSTPNNRGFCAELHMLALCLQAFSLTTKWFCIDRWNSQWTESDSGFKWL